MNTLSQGISAMMKTLLTGVADAARQSDRFGDVVLTDGMLSCAAMEAPEPAFYRLVVEDDALWVEWVTADRWLSQSIEAELVHTGDDLDDLIDEELVDLDYEGPKLSPLSHYRSEDMLYTFRSKIQLDLNGETSRVVDGLLKSLLAYEATFCELGDMGADDDD